MADKALENQLAGAAVLSWISPPPPEANQIVQRRAPKHAQGQGEKSQAPGGVGQEELKLKREIEALKTYIAWRVWRAGPGSNEGAQF